MKRRGIRRNHLAAASLATALLAGIASSCVSERVTAADNPSASGNCTIPTTSAAAGTVVIFIRNFTFIPQQVTIKRGTRVTWVNCEDAGVDAQTSTSDTGLWDYPRIAPTEIYSRVFNDPGTGLVCHCVPHPFMRGTINVEE
jgi:plastocyanin